MTVCESLLFGALATVVGPNTGKDFVSTRQLKNLRIDGGDVAFEVELGYPAKSRIALLRKALIGAADYLGALPLNLSIRVQADSGRRPSSPTPTARSPASTRPSRAGSQ